MKWVMTALSIVCFALALAKAIGLVVVLLRAAGPDSSDADALSGFWIIKQIVYLCCFVIVGVRLLRRSQRNSARDRQDSEDKEEP